MLMSRAQWLVGDSELADVAPICNRGRTRGRARGYGRAIGVAPP